jgi:hypothetical protein
MTKPWWSAGADWTATTEWWTDPALAYLAGLAHGAALERERQAVVDDVEHRANVQQLLDFLAVCEARDAADGRVS